MALNKGVDMSRKKMVSKIFLWFVAFVLTAVPGFAATAANTAGNQSATLWQLIVSGGVCMIFLGLLSVAAMALVIYHFWFVVPHKLTPPDFAENLLFLLEKKEYDKALSVCRQQENMISAIALRGLQKISKGKTVIEEAIQYEGKARIERMWQNLTYLGDIAVIAPLLGLLGTILGIIEAFGYFRAVSIHPSILTAGLAKAMVNTVFGLVIAVPSLIFYSFFRGRLSLITTNAERAASEIVHALTK
jgi:biopolymer transport protein ExbB